MWEGAGDCWAKLTSRAVPNPRDRMIGTGPRTITTLPSPLKAELLVFPGALNAYTKHRTLSHT